MMILNKLVYEHVRNVSIDSMNIINYFVYIYL